MYDPTLTLELPPLVSAASGMNAMAHAVEALYAANASPVALSLAEEAARLLASSLPRVVVDAARSRCARHRARRCAPCRAVRSTSPRWDCIIGSVTCSAARFGMPHARTHAALLPYVVAFNAPAAPAAMRAARPCDWA